MSVRILNDPLEGACFYDSTTGLVFGYVAADCEGCGLDASQILASFLAYAESAEVRDVRRMTRQDFEDLWQDFMAEEHDHEATDNPRKNQEAAYKAFMSMPESEWQGLLRSVLGGGVLEVEEHKGFVRALRERKQHTERSEARPPVPSSAQLVREYEQ